MENLKNVKFITEDDQEYIILFDKVISGEQFGYAINLHDESDTICVRIVKDDEGYFFDYVEDKNIIKEIMDLKRS